MKNIFPYFLFSIIIFACKNDHSLMPVEPLPDITSGLVVNISLDGNGFDSVSGNNAMEIKNVIPAINRRGEQGKAMQFSRNDSSFIDFGDLAGSSFPDNQFTVSCWVNVTDTLSPVCILSKRGINGPFEYSLDNHFNRRVFNFDNWIDNGGATVYGVDPLNASAKIELNTWQHIAFTADGAQLKAYLNGVLQQGIDNYQPNTFFSRTGAHFVIGNGGGWDRNYFFNGKIDDIRIYNYALDAETIKYLSQE